jgi:hypothetical protein
MLMRYSIGPGGAKAGRPNLPHILGLKVQLQAGLK